jgi:hypothetical protein
MDDQPVTPEPHPASAAAARAALHQLIERLTDEEVTAFWRLVCSWVVDQPHEPPGTPAMWKRLLVIGGLGGMFLCLAVVVYLVFLTSRSAARVAALAMGMY